MAKQKINFITSSKDKLAETKAILGDVVDLSNQPLDLVEIQGTIEEISRDKAMRAAAQSKTNGPVLVEDTSLCFNALKELPGPYIKWFFQALGHEGLVNLLLAYEDKSAQAVCTFAYSEGPGHEPIVFQGRTDGMIVLPRKNPGPVFGWDPIFEYQGCTYAEMDQAQKNTISHRSKALAKLKGWLDVHSQSQDQSAT